MNFKKMCSHPLLGASTLDFIKLILKNKGHLRARQLFRILYIFLSTILVSLIGKIENFFFQNRFQKQNLSKDPIFIIGHWRSGTTFLHYLMSKDLQYGYLSNSQAFMPHNMQLAKRFVQWLVGIHLLPKRPMDDVKMTPDCAQEEEFALSNYGQGAYLGWYFTQKMQTCFSKYLFLENCTAEEKELFKMCYKNLILKTAYVNGNKPLILKNPANTARIEVLLEMFPNAKFIYLHRNSHEVYYSTIKLHMKMAKQCAFEEINEKSIEKLVLEIYPKLIAQYESTKTLIPAGNLTEVAYNALINNPITTLKNIYKNLHLTGFEKAKPAFQAFLDTQKQYKPSVYSMKPETKRLIDLIWKASTTKYRATHMSVD